MSTNTKRLLLIIGISAIFCVLAGVAAVAGAALFANRIKDGVVTDQTKIQEMAHDFIQYELPPDYAEQMGMDLILYKMIFIGLPDDLVSKPMIVIAHFQAQNMSSEQMVQQMRQSIERQKGSSGLSFKVVETRKVTINGKETTMTVSEGSDRRGNLYRQWVTAFPGKTGIVLVYIQGMADDWDDSVFESFISSINT